MTGEHVELTASTVDRPNRQQRRASQSNRPPEAKKVEFTLGLLQNVINRWNKVVDTYPTFAARAYRGELIGVEYMMIRREFSDALYKASHSSTLPNRVGGEATGLAQFRQDLMRFEETDIYRRKVGGLEILGREGISLADIEHRWESKEGKPVDTDDIKYINRLYIQYRWPRSHPKDNWVRSLVGLFATQSLAREEVKTPPKLQPLFKAFTGYFGYYAELLNNLNISPWDEYRLCHSILRLGWFFQHTLGTFLAGYFGLTPASVMKMLKVRETGLFNFALSWRVANGLMLDEVADSYRANGFPQSLYPYQHYDKATDQKASQLLAGYYSQKEDDSTALKDAFTKAEALTLRLRRYQKVLQTDIREANGFLRFKLSNHPSFSEIILTSQYRQTLTFVLLFNDGKTHLTLEVNQANKLYGLPPTLSYEDPHIANPIFVDIAKPVLEEAQRRHPQIESVREVITLEDSGRRDLSPKINEAIEKVQVLTSPTTTRIRLAERLRATVPFAEPKPPSLSVYSRPHYRVIHSRSRLAQQLRKQPDDQVVQRAMEVIRRFERGETRAEISQEQGRFKLRVGSYRIILEHLGGRVYGLDRSGPRDQIYRKTKAAYR